MAIGAVLYYVVILSLLWHQAREDPKSFINTGQVRDHGCIPIELERIAAFGCGDAVNASGQTAAEAWGD